MIFLMSSLLSVIFHFMRICYVDSGILVAFFIVYGPLLVTLHCLSTDKLRLLCSKMSSVEIS